eukprot:468844-Prymnesium_polylepis.1
MPSPSHRCGRVRTRAECTCAPSPVGPRRASPGCVSASWSSPLRKPAPPRPAAPPPPPAGCTGARGRLREHGRPPWHMKQQNSFGSPLKDEVHGHPPRLHGATTNGDGPTPPAGCTGA